MTIDFPSNLTTINENAFYQCSSLQSITLPSLLTSIGINAFFQCNSLTTIDFPSNLETINISAFLYCNGLTSISFPSSINVIDYNAFANCSNLAYATFNGQILPQIQFNSFSDIAYPSTAYVQKTMSTSDKTTLSSYFTYVLAVICFKENTKILTNNGYIPIQDLKIGDLVKTLNHGFVPIHCLGKRKIYHDNSLARTKSKLYKYTDKECPEIFEDLVITGCHCILINEFESEEQKNEMFKLHGDIYVTDNLYRLAACVDKKASVFDISGSYEVYHIALEHENKYKNYGIYANGLLVESCSKWSLKESSDYYFIE
jgi:hypothetical protein